MAFPTMKLLLVEASKWDVVRADPGWMNPDISSAKLSKKYGVDHSTLVKHRKADGFVKRIGPTKRMQALLVDPDFKNPDVTNATLAKRHKYDNGVISRARKKAGIKPALAAKQDYKPTLLADPDFNDTSVSNGTLAKRHGTNSSSVRNARLAAGIKSTSKTKRSVQAPELEDDPDFMNPKVSHAELAKKYGLSKVTILNRRKKQGSITSKKQPEYFSDPDFLNPDISNSELARKYGLDPKTVQAARKRKGITSTAKGQASKRNKRLRATLLNDPDLHNANISNAEIAKRYGVVKNTVRNARDQLGIKSLARQDRSDFWTDEDFKDPYVSSAEIARRYGVTTPAVAHARRSQGIKSLAKAHQKPWHYSPILKRTHITHAEATFLLRMNFPSEDIKYANVKAARLARNIRSPQNVKQPKDPQKFINTFEDDDLLTDNNMTDEEVSEELGVPLATVYYKRNMMNIHRPKIKKPLGNSRLLREPLMHDESLADSVVAHTLDMKYANVYYIRDRLGIKRPKD